MQKKIALATIAILGSALFAATIAMSLLVQPAAAGFIVCAKPGNVLTCVNLGPPPGIVPKVGVSIDSHGAVDAHTPKAGVSIDPRGAVNVHTPNADVNIGGPGISPLPRCSPLDPRC